MRARSASISGKQQAVIIAIRNSPLQLYLTNMTPRKGVRTKKADKNSDSESEMPSPSDTARVKEVSHMAKSTDLAKVNPKLFGRLLGFGGMLFVTLATRFYAIEDPSHIW